MTPGYPEQFYDDLADAGVDRAHQLQPAALPVYRAWVKRIDELKDRYEKNSLIRSAAFALRDNGRDAEEAHFWIGVFKESLDHAPEELSDGCWQLMDSIGRVATEENFDEMAALTEDPFYIQCMTPGYKTYFARSKDPRVPEVLRRLMEPEEVYDEGQIILGARIAADRKFLELIPNVERLRARLEAREPGGNFDTLDDALYRLYRALYAQQVYAGGKASVDIPRVLADLNGVDGQRAAFAAYVLGDLKAAGALGRLRELTTSSNVQLRREAKTAVKKLEKVSA
ncbi:hypothetical protein [uncultured Leifsonia sp.]|uniref:hypothetical protein n=1 Tax=uncultured Leifsonia sp. TaxID=340359 RepID=UPI0028D5FCD8|nr:hypothetical protein [uncultured Leifsonia sp.]